MDFLCKFKSLNYPVFNVTLGGFYHGFQGRIKDINRIFIEFKLFRICKFPKLTELVVNVKHNGVLLTHGDVSLLSEMEDRFAEGVRGDMALIYSK